MPCEEAIRSIGLGVDAPESARRLALAKWLTDPKNPLTPRVIINRMWHYHFGQGIVNRRTVYRLWARCGNNPLLESLDCPDHSVAMANNCLAARRLIERGVRTVQLWTGDGISWDAHEDIKGSGYKSHTGEALRMDRPVAGLIRDLRQSGLLDSTLVMITTEFGRTPYAQAAQGKLSRGRDHHPEGFTNVLVGGGLRRGFAYGATDPIGYTAVENPITIYDMHATVLHLMGIDHERLTFYHNGIQRMITNVHYSVIKELLA